ncbi:MAG TPA: hypothetical protein VMB34_32775 [Acetobacteraceae bacterium]|nr:hypothetical protein [Acetobacteraceae bacterium]
MSGNYSSDRPFGRDTVKIGAVFVPEAAKHQISTGEVKARLGYGPVKIPAVFVAPGEAPPGYPYVNVGPVEFRLDATDQTQSAEDSTPPAAPAEPSPPPKARPVLPPNPARTLAGGDPAPARMTGWPWANAASAWRNGPLHAGAAISPPPTSAANAGVPASADATTGATARSPAATSAATASDDDPAAADPTQPGTDDTTTAEDLDTRDGIADDNG